MDVNTYVYLTVSSEIKTKKVIEYQFYKSLERLKTIYSRWVVCSLIFLCCICLADANEFEAANQLNCIRLAAASPLERGN